MDRKIYNDIVKEHFDVMDTETRRCLLSINEADQDQVLGSLAAKLYDNIVNKVTEIDFGQIPLSKGDITKIPNYHDLCECLTTVHEMMVAKHQTTHSTDTIFGAIENLKKTKRIWEKGYAIECEMAVVFYNTIALSIVSSTSILLSACIEFVKNPESGVIDIELAKIAKNKSLNGILFKNLEHFNKSCKKGEIEKTFDNVLKAQRTVKEAVENESSVEAVKEDVFAILFGAGMAIGLLSCVIPILHQLTTMLYNLRQDASDYFAVESDIIKLNAEKVNYNRTKTPEQKKKIIAKQMKIADRFKNWSNKLMIKSSKAETDSEKQIKQENAEKKKIGDVVDTMPDSASIF